MSTNSNSRVAFIGSECYPFVKTGGLGDVMYALPRALVKQNCDVKVILPKYACIKDQWKEKMIYRGAFDMNLCSDGRSFYVGIMEYVDESGVVYDSIDNEEFFTSGNPYTNLVDDIPKFCYFGKAALAGLLVGATLCGILLAISMANSGGAWDNAKKYIESGTHGGKGSENHKATVVGDTVGDPFKDTAGPAINILIKLLSMVSIVFAALVTYCSIL